MDTPSETGSFSTAVTTAIGVTGFLLLLWSVLEPVYLLSIDSSVIFEARYQIGYLTIIPSCVGMIYASRRLPESGIPADRDSKIGAYWLVGGSGFLVFNVGLMSFFPTDSVWILTNWVRWALSLGLAVGLVIGIAQARAIFSTLTAERQSLRAEHVEKQRDLVDQMNGILRHEVLNSAQVITGNASLLMDSDDPIDPDDERLRRIHRQGMEVTNVVREVRLLLRTIEDDREFGVIDLATVVETEIRKIEDQYPGVDVSFDSQDEVPVQADELSGRIFANLLRNAVEHNDAEPLQITVDVETVDGTAVVTIEDTGSGIPERNRETLFDRPKVSDKGLGLYLVRELTNSYDGTIELLETGEDGTTFECRFPVADSSATGSQDE